MSQFELGELNLRLERYPQQNAASALQAWDAADEYLLQNADMSQLNGRPLLLLNDSFGTLACALSDHHPVSISDSYLSQLATWHNLKLNGLNEEGITLQDSLSPWPDAPGIVLIKIPRTMSLLEQQLRKLREVATPDTVIIASAKAKDIHTSTLQLFEKILGPTTTSLAWKKARLIYATLADVKPSEAQETLAWSLDGTKYQIHNHANVFSRTGLDIGARLFLKHLPKDLEGPIADLGCGNGVIGLRALEKNPDASMLFVDESYMAVASSQMNVEINRPDDIERCSFDVNNGLAGVERGSLRAVLCNPPFHQLSSITDEIAWQMFIDARRCLMEGGELWIVGNRHLGYHQKLKRLFGNCTLVASNKKFVILKTIKKS